MKTVKEIPSRAKGSVGDRVKFKGKVFQKASNGKWGMELTSAVKEEVLRLYGEGNTLRKVALLMSIEGHVFPHGHVQRIVTESKSMRSHYGERDRKSSYLERNKDTLFELFDSEGFSLVDLAYVTGVIAPDLTAFFAANGRKHKAGTRADAERFQISNRMSANMCATWNSILGRDSQDMCYHVYRNRARRLTDIVYQRYRTYGERRSLNMHLDHKVSIYDAYWTRDAKGRRVKRDRVMPLSALAHPLNLRLVFREVNLEKGDKSLHAVEEMERMVNKHKLKLCVVNRKKELRLTANKFNLRPYDKS